MDDVDGTGVGQATESFLSPYDTAVFANACYIFFQVIRIYSAAVRPRARFTRVLCTQEGPMRHVLATITVSLFLGLAAPAALADAPAEGPQARADAELDLAAWKKKKKRGKKAKKKKKDRKKTK